MTGVVVIAGILVVNCLLWYIWKHRTGAMARGVGAAGARYNELYGQGRPPQIPPPAAHGSADLNDGDGRR